MIILGSTGSVGINAITVAKQFGLEIEGLVCKGNTTLLNVQIQALKPKFVGIYDYNASKNVKALDSRLFVGKLEILDMLALCNSKKILNAIVGFGGLCFSVKALQLGMQLILANKESLVIAGALIKHMLGGVKLSNRIFSIDSEHFGLYTLVNSADIPYKNLYITASGGALRDMHIDRIKEVTLKDVLAHPTWDMGNRITIDSATMVNKLYEILEAFWLFDTKNIHALIERNSIIHALVEFSDNSLLASLSATDMKLPIAYGLDMQKAKDRFSIESIGIKDLIKIDFQEIDSNHYPLWTYKDLLLESPHLGIILNACNEYLQDLFLQEKIPFFYFEAFISKCLHYFRDIPIPLSMEAIESLRLEVVAYLRSIIK